jgi:PKD repeat protein
MWNCVSRRWASRGIWIIAIAVAAAVGAFAVGGASGLSGVPVYDSSFGSSGQGNGQFSLPVSLAMSSTGNVFVADQQNNRVQEFDASGNWVRTFGAADGLSGATGVAVGSDGSVFVVDSNNHRVLKYDSAGALQTSWGGLGGADGQFIFPVGIAIAGDGDVLVTDLGNDRVQRFTSLGVFESKFGSNGSGDGQFNDPYDIAVAGDGTIYVSERGGDRVQAFSDAGVFQRRIDAGFGTGDGQVRDPLGLSVDGSGDVFVADSVNNRIQVFTSGGVFRFSFGGSFDSGPGQMNGPGDVLALNATTALVADSENNRIQKWVGAANTPPVAVLTVTPDSGPAPLEVQLDGSGSYDPDPAGNLTDYTWDFGDGSPTQSGFVAGMPFTYAQPGSYTVSLTVTDVDGSTDTATQIVTVTEPPNQPPNAFIYDSYPSSVTVGEEVLFNFYGNDLDGPVTLELDFGDGSAPFIGDESSGDATHTYTEPGSYTPVLTVTDNVGSVTSFTGPHAVDVIGGNEPPTLGTLEADPPVGSVPHEVVASVTGASDPDGSVVEYRFDWGDGTSTTSTDGVSSHTYRTVGDYFVTATVVDNGGGVTVSDPLDVISMEAGLLEPPALDAVRIPRRLFPTEEAEWLGAPSSAARAAATERALAASVPSKVVNKIIVMGDSFSSGEGADYGRPGPPDYYAGACHRHFDTYASQVGWSKKILACSGAKLRSNFLDVRLKGQRPQITSTGRVRPP